MTEKRVYPVTVRLTASEAERLNQQVGREGSSAAQVMVRAFQGTLPDHILDEACRSAIRYYRLGVGALAPTRLYTAGVAAERLMERGE